MWQVLTAQAEGLDPERLSRTYAALMVERQLQEATRMNADEDMQDAGTRDSFCSSASTDPGGGVSPRESMPALSPCASPRAHEEATRAGSVPAAAAEVQDAASRPPGADSFPFAGPAPPGWKPDASFSLEHALHKELLQQLITLVVDTRGSSLVFLLLAFLLQLSRVFRAHIPKSLSLPRLLDRRVSRPNPGSLPRNPLFPLSTVSSLFITSLVLSQRAGCHGCRVCRHTLQ